MLITFKNLQQQSFQIEIDVNKTVKELKQMIENEKGNDYAVENQRLIYAGKILIDDNSIASYNIDEKKFIVVMVTKPKAAESTPVVADIAAASSEGGDAINSASATTTNVTSETGAPTTTAPSSIPSINEAVTISDPEYESNVESLMEMGYSRLLVEQALRASFNNRERAVEYLIQGIPDDILQEQEQDADESGGELDAASGEVDPLAFLRNQPQFQQMRAVIQQNPNLLNVVLQQIGQTNPALLQAISQHQQAFVRMLNEPVNASSGNTDSTTPPTSQPQQNVIQVSTQDKEAIERLKALGFPEHMVIQAYFACEKNENLAANFLLSQNFED